MLGLHLATRREVLDELKQILRPRIKQKFTERTTLEQLGINTIELRQGLFANIELWYQRRVPEKYDHYTDLTVGALVDIIVPASSSNGAA
jgi:hypothetical protein